MTLSQNSLLKKNKTILVVKFFTECRREIFKFCPNSADFYLFLLNSKYELKLLMNWSLIFFLNI